MSASVTGASTCSNNRIEPHELSYGEVTVLSSGGIISKQMKIDLRKQMGYCLTCSHVPVLLIDIRRSRINPLWISKKPRTADGECIEGRCLKCAPKRDISCGTVASSRNVQLARTLSVASSISSCSIGSNTTPRISVTGPEQIQNGRMLPPRTPSRSSSGSTAGFYAASSRRTPQSCYGSRNGSPMRGVSRGQSSMNSYDDADSVTLDSQRALDISNVLNSTHINCQISNVTASKPSSTDSSYETRKDTKNKMLKQILPDTSKLEPIQAMLKEMKDMGKEIFMECLMTAMESNPSDQHVQHYCLATIRDELEDDDEDGTINDSLIAMKGTSRILDSMTNFPTSVTIQEIGCATLLAMASNDENRSCLIESGACDSLHRAIDINCRERSIVEMCFSALRILSTEVEGRNSMLQVNVSKSVIAAMQYNISSVLIQQDGCAILSNLTVDVRSNSVTLVSNDEIAVIVEAMQVYNNDEAVMASACFALKNFAYNAQNLRSMNRANNVLEALEDAALFDSLSISASQTSEKLYLSQAEDESMVDHAYRVLMKTISTQSDDPEIMVVIIESLREFKWSSTHVAACLKKLKPLALTSQPHLLTFLDNITLKELYELNTEAVKSEVTILARLYDSLEN